MSIRHTVALIAIFAGLYASNNAETAEANAAAAAIQEALAAAKADEALEYANAAATAEVVAVAERDIAQVQTRQGATAMRSGTDNRHPTAKDKSLSSEKI